MKPHIKSMTIEELDWLMDELGQPRYRAGQIFSWLHRGVEHFSEMTNLPKSLQQALENKFLLSKMIVRQELRSKIDDTVKYLFELTDGHTVESVLMEYEHGVTACISTQVGCRMGCVFCASTVGGFIRNLEAGEMLDQILFMQKASDKRISHIVLMGMGEPLDNFDSTLRFLRLVSDPKGLHIGQRRITLSTCGLTEQIDRLADQKMQITLSVSLHSPEDDARCRIIPAGRNNPVERLIASCERYDRITGRRISFEYAMIDGVTDSTGQALALAALLRNLRAHVNLIPLNQTEHSLLKPSAKKRIQTFAGVLQSKGIAVTIRRRLGGDIEASCGQLHRFFNKEEGVPE